MNAKNLQKHKKIINWAMAKLYQQYLIPQKVVICYFCIVQDTYC